MSLLGDAVGSLGSCENPKGPLARPARLPTRSTTLGSLPPRPQPLPSPAPPSPREKPTSSGAQRPGRHFHWPVALPPAVSFSGGDRISVGGSRTFCAQRNEPGVDQADASSCVQAGPPGKTRQVPGKAWARKTPGQELGGGQPLAALPAGSRLQTRAAPTASLQPQPGAPAAHGAGRGRAMLVPAGLGGSSTLMACVLQVHEACALGSL